MSKPKKIKRTVYDHGGSRIWAEDEKGNRELIADTYDKKFSDIIFKAVEDESGKENEREGD